MMDVHVLTHSGTRQQWLDECLESLRRQPCTVHVVRGIEGNIAAGREIGFALGTSPYLSFVDSDDLAEPGAIETMLEVMETGVPSAVGLERRLLPDGVVGEVIRGHHLFVIRRDVLTQHLTGWGERMKKTHCVPALSNIAPPKQVNKQTYWWRAHFEQTSRRGLQ